MVSLFAPILLAILVAVIDTGVDVSHPHFASTEIAAYNAVDGSVDITDECMHGTAVAGVVVNHAHDAAVILAIKATRGCLGTSTWLADAIRFATDRGAKVITISLSTPYPSHRVEDAIAYAVAQGGMVIIAAAGNGGKDVPPYPAGYEQVIAVGCDPTKYGWSNYGEWIDQIEECHAVVPVTIGGEYRYAYRAGTSFAAPAAAGKLAREMSGLRDMWLPWVGW